ncbi:HlyD family efflux transporter periplasmic adaptor subunit [Haliscomenobacter sp.]|uniref:HlyD family efflux transporter periplasmic adaptor subunit n=1 Tax=Haliscomenobacter sp. TaxID=2717303 RepID=UPI003593D207
MKELEDIEIRSEEVQEILGTPPSWMVRWGSLSAFALFVVLMWLSFLVKYPDAVDADIRLVSKDPPVRLTAFNANRIDEVIVKNNTRVDSGQALIAFRSTANFRHVLSLEDYITALPSMRDEDLLKFKVPSNLVLGELQADLFDFQDVQLKYNSEMYKNLSSSDLRSSQSRISRLDRSLDYQKEMRRQIQEQIAEAEQERKNKEHLVSVDQASQEDVNRVHRRIMELNKELIRTETEIRDRESELSALRIKVRSLESGADNETNFASDVLRESFTRLREGVNTWKQRYIIESPRSGLVQIVGRNVAENSFVYKDEQLMVILPNKNKEIVGKMFIPFNRSGRVKIKQKVIVRLESLDFQEFGVLEGEVAWKALSPRDDGEKSEVAVEVIFPNKMITTAGKVVATEEELYGEARIITEERRFIERIFSGIRGYSNY